MTRMWCVNPEILCRQHLLGEHKELHMIIGNIRNKKSLHKYLLSNQIQLNKIIPRHKELTLEMKKRGYNHHSNIHHKDILKVYWRIIREPIKSHINVAFNLKDLSARCERCRKNIQGEV